MTPQKNLAVRLLANGDQLELVQSTASGEKVLVTTRACCCDVT